ncbi:MAG: glycosyltransferase [Bacteroidales bacterium]|nr:glycosyltransferase [Bacteroidales bacterium]
MKVKIIHLISSLAYGGRERQLLNILVNRPEHSVIVFNNTSKGYHKDIELPNFTFLKERKALKRLKELRRLIKNEKPDILWSWGAFEAYYGSLSTIGLKTIHINGSIRHGIVLFNLKQVSRLILLQLSKYRVSNSLAGLKANYLRKGLVLRNGIDDKFFAETQQIELKYLAKKECFSFITIANLVPYKDYFTILEALKEVYAKGYNFKYQIVGEGPMRKQIQTIVNDLGFEDKVELLGIRTDVHSLLASADIYIHSSKGEGLSNAIIEAMASGLPCVATDTGGTNELLPACQLFKFKDSEGLSGILMKWMDNEVLLKSVALQMHERARNQFSIETMVHNYDQILTTILEKQ